MTAMIDINTSLPLYIRPIFDESGLRIIGALEMTSLRGLDGLHSKPDEGNKLAKSGLSIRDESVLDNLVKLLSRGLTDIDERSINTGQGSIYSFNISAAELKDPNRLINHSTHHFSPNPRGSNLVKQQGDSKSLVEARNRSSLSSSDKSNS